jgi:hypothetical protein
MNAASSTWVFRTGLLVVFVLLDLMFIKYNGAGGDWSPIWVVGRLALSDPSLIYQFDLVSTLQHPLVGDLGQRPFVYPPTTLMLAVPFSVLPFYQSLFLFGNVALALMVWASRRWTNDGWLLVASLPVFAAAYSGQVTLIVGALILFGVAKLDDRPVKAGVLLGMAAVLKPQLLVLAPIALIAGRHWRSIIAATATAAIAIVLTTIAFGIDLWRRWIEALGPFQALIEGYGPLLRNALSPHATALRIGADPTGAILVSMLVTIPVVAFVFARTQDPAGRLVALVGGALFISPYAMNYELATLAPVALERPLKRMRDMALPLTFSVSMAASASLAGLVAIYLWMLSRLAKTMEYPTAQPDAGSVAPISQPGPLRTQE